VGYLTQEAEIKEIKWIPDVGLGLEAFRNMKVLHKQYCRSGTTITGSKAEHWRNWLLSQISPDGNLTKDTGVELAVEIHWGRLLKSLRKEDSEELSMSHNATGNSC
jgi:hypothetical protein